MKIKRKKFLRLAAPLTALVVAFSAAQLLTGFQATQVVHAADVTVSTQTELNAALTAAPTTPYAIAIDTNFSITSQITIPANKNITITSSDPANPVTLTRDAAYNGVLFGVSYAGAQLTLTDIIIDGGSRTTGVTSPLIVTTQTVELKGNTVLQNNINTALGAGGAINASGGATVKLLGNATITNNFGAAGGGVNMNASTLTLSGNSHIDNNTATGATTGGGGVYSLNLSTISLSDNATINGNSSAGPGGAIRTLGGTVSLSKSAQVNGNTGSNSGSAIYTQNAVAVFISDTASISNNVSSGLSFSGSGASLTMTGGSFTNNSGSNGGAIVSTTASTTIDISGGTFTNNTATSNGGAIYQTVGTLKITGGTFTNNSAATGGAIHASAAAATPLQTTIGDNVVFNDNHATGAGGAIYAVNNNFTQPLAATFTNNYSGNGGGAIFLNAGSDAFRQVLTINGATFTGNYTVGPTSNRHGGAINVQDYNTLNIKSGTFNDNHAHGNGGAVYVAQPRTNFIMSGGNFTDNYIEQTFNVYGGAIYAQNSGIINITGGNFSNNHAKATSGNSLAYGGGLYVTNGTGGTTVQNITLTNNQAIANGTATAQGGGAYIVSTNFVAPIRNITATGNTATSQNYTTNPAGNGGGLSIGGNNGTKLIELDNLTIDHNTAASISGGIYVTDFINTKITNSTFTRNTATNGTGGGINFASSGTASAHKTITIADTIFGGSTANANSAGTNGGGLYAGSYTDIILQGNSAASNNLAGQSANGNGGGLYANVSSSITLKDNAEVNNNQAGKYTFDGTVYTAVTSGIGGGVYLVNGTATDRNSLTMSDNTQINDNLATNTGGGASLSNFSTVTIDGGVSGVPQMNGNRAFSSGGGLNVGTGAEVDISGLAEIKNNTAGLVATGATGGGINVAGGSLDISGDVVVSGNKTTGNGGGVYVAGVTSAVDISGDVVIIGNEATSGSGGGIYDTGIMDISERVVIRDNVAALNGGGLYSTLGSLLSITDYVVINNNSCNEVNDVGGGGGIWINGATATISSNVAITNNKARANGGGGIYVSNAASSLSISGSVNISGNSSTVDGGGIYLRNTLVNPVSISGAVSITGNTAAVNGGAIWTDYLNLDKLNVASGVVFTDNSAGSYDPTVATADLPVYNSHIFVPLGHWSLNPAASGTFLRGYNNYDISYTAVKYNVTYDSNGGSAVAGDVVYQGDEAIQPADPVRSGYKFLGWYATDPVSGNLTLWDFSTVLTSDITLVAQWQGTPGVPNTGPNLLQFAQDNAILTISAIVAVWVGLVAGIVAVGGNCRRLSRNKAEK